jgi:predicted nucleic acid-binding protein
LSAVVIDASVALAWCLPDEASGYAETVLSSLEGSTILVPAVWTTEVTNGVLMAERRRRIQRSEIQRFVGLLDSLTVVVDVSPVTQFMDRTLPLAREYGLSAYDASYLEVAVRHSAPLASLDLHLRKACRKAGMEIFRMMS